jgi:hypothetical protein
MTMTTKHTNAQSRKIMAQALRYLTGGAELAFRARFDAAEVQGIDGWFTVQGETAVVSPWIRWFVSEQEVWIASVLPGGRVGKANLTSESVTAARVAERKAG